jgi:hypothetical protein
MIFEIAAGIVLGLFAFILIYRYWRRLLIAVAILVSVFVIGVAMAVIIANNHTAAVIWGNVTKDWSFVYACLFLVLLEPNNQCILAKSLLHRNSRTVWLGGSRFAKPFNGALLQRPAVRGSQRPSDRGGSEIVRTLPKFHVKPTG